jgi:hypothetical protein
MPCNVAGPDLIGTEAGARVWQMMRALADLVDRACER